MPWCPRCKAEYREGYFWCSDCEVKLVDETAELEDTPESFSRGIEDKEWRLLEIINDDQEADIVESFLASEGIPVRRQYKGVSHMSKVAGGMSKLGTHLYVPRSWLEDAREILQAVHNGVPVLAEEEYYGQEANNRQYEAVNDNDAQKGMEPFSRLLLLAVIVLVGAMILSVYSILQGY